MHVKRSMEEVGLAPRDAWRFMWVAFTVNSIVALIGSVTVVPALDDPAVRIVILFALLSAPIWFVCERRGVSEKWIHVPFWIAAAIYLIVAIQVGGMRSNMAIIMYSAALTTAAMHPPRFAAPHIGFAFVAVSAMVLTSDEAHEILRAMTLASVFGLMVAYNLFNHGLLTRLVAANKRLAETDPLTGLPNVRRMRNAIEAALPSAGRAGRRVALFALDLDNFKRVNDELTHSTGDQMLRAVADAASAPLGPGDFIARRGGDEFAILVSDSGERDLDALAAEISDGILCARREICPEFPAAASVGYVIARQGESTDRLLARADDQLHEAKLSVHPERRQTLPRLVSQLDLPATGGPGAQVARERQPAARSARRSVQSPLNPRGRTSQEIVKQRFASLALMLAGSLPLAGAVWGIEQLREAQSLGLALAIALVGVVALVRTRRGANWGEFGAYGLLGAGFFIALVARTGEAGIAMLELMLLPMMFVIFAGLQGKLRVALLMFGVGMPSLLLYYVFLTEAGYPHIADRIFGVAIFLIGDAMVVGQEESRIRKFSEANEEMAGSDSLTGVANLRRLHDRISVEMSTAEASGRPFAVLMLDLDFFKQVNDVYSHTVGDRVLHASAEAISNCRMPGDLVARRGGDEFMVVTSLTDDDKLQTLARTLDAAVERARLAFCPDLPATASIGSAVWRSGDTAVQLLRRADDSAQVAKRDVHRRYEQHAVQTLAFERT